ncbi:UNVERIFIED_CONTAM: hypothetical protein GTU68_051909 [Idotea baltica]|jgi:DeoR/GlpR family transcriptional regulator of sugar metabolism|nr:hypothetical protein [Idotea baltica]
MILSLLIEKGEITVEELSELFDISEVTIRKDLTELEKNGLLMRKYGGAVLMPSNIIQEDNCEEVSNRKLSLAISAVELIKDHNRIIIDSGSTTAALINQLSKKNGLVVMTNSLPVANALQEIENEPTLLMTGGTWDSHSDSFQGQVAESVLRSYDFDQLFIGADGIDLERGTTTFNELVGLSRVMSEVAREVILMVESEKIGRKIPNVELPWDSIDVLITNNDLSQEHQQKIESHNVRVIRAQ